MPAERLVVIGGVAAGMSAASRARHLKPELEVVVLEKGDYISYGTCGLTYFVAGIVPRAEDLLVYSPEFFRTRRGIDVRTAHEALEVVPGQKLVLVRREGEVFPLAYDKLVIATGAAPRLEIPGADLPGVFTANDLGAALRLRQFLEERRPRHGVVVGAGYIGLEVAEALAHRQVQVRVVERSATLLEDSEAEIDTRVSQCLEAHGIQVLRNTVVTGLEQTPHALQVVCTGNQVLSTEVVVLATGLKPRAELAARTGVHLGRSGGILTDHRQQTNLPSIYAAGDCVETLHLVTNQPTYIPLGTTANKQGRVAGENAAGGYATFPGVVGTLITKLFELEVGRTGLSVASARAAGFSPESVFVDSVTQARYLGGKPLRATLVADRMSGRVLGAQLVGTEGAARRVDVVATAITGAMTIADFVHLDLGYAPPYGPVYDPLLVAAWQLLKRMGRRR